jgi:Zn-dependent peptidase ImmA (M78 family)
LQFKRGFKANAERIALKVRGSMGLSVTHAFDPEEACRRFEIELIPMMAVGCDCSAFEGLNGALFSAVTVSRGIRTAIVHNDCHHVHRQRSNICHELAHLFLGHKAYPPLTRNGDRFYDKGIEAEADFLGGALLLPKDTALHILRAELRSRAQHIYGVSKPMLDWRLRVSGAEIIFNRSRARRS